jgi:enterochelin esterase-like enzyme
MLLFLVACAFLVGSGQASRVQLDVYYPESLVTVNSSTRPFVYYGVSSVPYRQPSSAGFFGDYTSQGIYNNASFRVGADHWRVLVDVGSFTGTLYVILTASGLSSVSVCEQHSPAWGPECIPRTNTHQTVIPNSSADSVYPVVMYPVFSYEGVGVTEVTLPGFASASLGNSRDVSVHYPYSLVENTIGRAVQVMVVLDGDLQTLSLLMTRGGIDGLMAIGALPETVFIGVPGAATGLYCNASQVAAGLCRQRNYEFTPTQCDPARNVPHCGGVAWTPTGGGDILLDFVVDEVIPAVMRAPQLRGVFSVADIGIAGYSLGGLMACYAAGTRARVFTRALCESPSVYYNDGQLLDQIAIAFRASGGAKPKSVVMTVGSQENAPMKGNKFWLDYCTATIEAFVQIGLGPMPRADLPVHPDGNPQPALTSSNAILLFSQGGMHSLNQWLQMIGFSMPLLFQSQYPGGPFENMRQRDFDIQWVYPPADSAPSSGPKNEFTQTQVAVAALVPTFALLVITFILGRSIIRLQSKLNRHVRSPNELNEPLLEG